MNKIGFIGIALALTILQGCGTLDEKLLAISVGDSKEKVTQIMGTPYDRQLQNTQEAWQYCVSGAGFGYNDHKIIWFEDSKVTGITSYRTQRSGCTGAVKTISWEEAPDVVIEHRER